jgi:hypothetical protein
MSQPSHRQIRILQNQNQRFLKQYLVHADYLYQDVIEEYFVVLNLDEP